MDSKYGVVIVQISFVAINGRMIQNTANGYDKKINQGRKREAPILFIKVSGIREIVISGRTTLYFVSTR